MISIFLITITISFFSCVSKNNPVKMKMSLMLASLVIFFLTKILSSNSWLPFIFSMLYLGGILMMFMILSSFSPNSKMKSNFYSISLIILLIYSELPNTIFSFSEIKNLKIFMEEKINFFFMIIWVLTFFFGFMMILSDCRLSMRSIFKV